MWIREHGQSPIAAAVSGPGGEERRHIKRPAPISLARRQAEQDALTLGPATAVTRPCQLLPGRSLDGLWLDRPLGGDSLTERSTVGIE